MRAFRTLRGVGAAAAAVAVVLSVAPVQASAATTPVGSQSDVRLVVRTLTRAAGADVAEAGVRTGARRAGRVPRLKAVSLQVTPGRADAVRRALLRRGDVTSVEVAHRRWLAEEPADTRFGEQRTYLDAVRATTAWGRPAHGAPDVRIAVIDSGVDVTHPDLAGKIAGSFNALTRGRDVRDLVGHGTGVASVAGAATGNGEGIAGAGYDSSILAVKVADRTGRIFTDDLAAGVVWAVDNGADVINLSLGGPASDQLERDAVSYAQRHGVLVVAAAGNEGTAAKQFPAALPGVLSVGATSANGSSRVAFSSYGPWVDVAAPGRGIVVAAPGGRYERADGTSYSSPLVAGQVALLAAYRPGRTADELADAVVSSANSAKLGFARGLVDFEASLDLLPPGSTPTITAPAGGSVVSGHTTVTASSTAARVRLTLADLSATVDTSGGVASASFETFGLSGPQQVTATDCSRIDQCSSSTAAVAATVANAAPTLTSPADGSPATADTLRAAADAPGGAVRFRLDDGTTETDLSAPYAADLSTARLGDGPHAVSATLCRSDGTVCASGTASSATVDVTRLHPAITRVAPRLFSPTRDGRKDQTRLRYALDGPQVVTLRVRSASGELVLTRRIGEQPTGSHTAVWDGRRSGGQPVRSGTYSLEVSTAQPAGSLVGLATRSVTVDRGGPKPTDVTRTSSSVLPVRDGYRDDVTVQGTLRERVRWVELQVRSRSGALVRTERIGRRKEGPVQVRWDGRTERGRIAPSGTYSARLVAQDIAGNQAGSAPVRIAVSGARLVRRTGSMTVTARASLNESFADDCSLVFRHTSGARKGWLGYYSSGTCSSGDAYAVGDHQVRLPKAVRYGTIRVSAYGGRADEKFRDSARIVYHDRYENLSKHQFRLPPALGMHTGPTVKASKLVFRKRVFRWSTFTTKVAWYDVQRYGVRFTYDVLR
jgi:subtilisin family serine protease/flagellar hook assembly protein FlgD